MSPVAVHHLEIIAEVSVDHQVGIAVPAEALFVQHSSAADFRPLRAAVAAVPDKRGIEMYLGLHQGQGVEVIDEAIVVQDFSGVLGATLARGRRPHAETLAKISTVVLDLAHLTILRLLLCHRPMATITTSTSLLRLLLTCLQ